MSTYENRMKIHMPTLIAISIIAWVLVDIMHEIVGHAGAAIIMGVPVKAVSTSTVYLYVDWEQFITDHGLNPIRLFTLGGTIVNIVTGALALLALKWNSWTRLAREFYYNGVPLAYATSVPFGTRSFLHFQCLRIGSETVLGIIIKSSSTPLSDGNCS